MDRSRSGAVRDSASIPIVESAAPAWPDGLGGVGRRSGGAGQSQMLIMMIGMPGDSLLTFDGMNRRMSVFGPAGGHVRDFGGTEAA